MSIAAKTGHETSTRENPVNTERPFGAPVPSFCAAHADLDLADGCSHCLVCPFVSSTVGSFCAPPGFRMQIYERFIRVPTPDEWVPSVESADHGFSPHPSRQGEKHHARIGNHASANASRIAATVVVRRNRLCAGSVLLLGQRRRQLAGRFFDFRRQRRGLRLDPGGGGRQIKLAGRRQRGFGRQG
jgi:hypothetical protein